MKPLQMMVLMAVHVHYPEEKATCFQALWTRWNALKRCSEKLMTLITLCREFRAVYRLDRVDLIEEVRIALPEARQTEHQMKKHTNHLSARKRSRKKRNSHKVGPQRLLFLGLPIRQIWSQRKSRRDSQTKARVGAMQHLRLKQWAVLQEESMSSS